MSYYDDQEFMDYETALNADANRQIERLGKADLLIGIPTHRNGRTIPEVLEALSQGIARYYPHRRVILMNADGGSSDSTVRHVREAQMPPNVAKLFCTYEGITGKGTAIRAIFEAAGRLHVKACLVVEARAPNIQPEWVPALVNPVLYGDDMAVGFYHRSAYAMSLCDNLAYPFLRTFFNANLRDPLAGEFCVSGETAVALAECDVWETNVSRFGVNIWIAIHCLVNGRRISQVDLGYRGEGGGEPGMPLDARFLHTVSTLFRSLTTYRRIWQREQTPRKAIFRGSQYPDESVPEVDCVPILVEAMREGKVRYANEWQTALNPQVFGQVCALLEQPVDRFTFPKDLWANVALSFAMLFNKGEGDPDKVSEALLPLFYGRTAAYLLEAHEMTPLQREHLVEEIVGEFVKLRAPFMAKWNSYQPWIEDSPIYWLT